MDAGQHRRGNAGLVSISRQLIDCIHVYMQRIERANVCIGFDRHDV